MNIVSNIILRTAFLVLSVTTISPITDTITNLFQQVSDGLDQVQYVGR
ncbi:MAG: hypothetical protein PHX38_08005 [Sulfuricella sp.]|nr:hypothetical protein [Sulfuricella sp.]